MTRLKVAIINNEFDFLRDADYEETWNFLKIKDRKYYIGRQLTYLHFHEYLFRNIRTGDSSTNGLYGNIAEGFLRTDIIIYASICETALLDVICWEDTRFGTEAPKCIRKLLSINENKTLKLSNNTLTINIDNDRKATGNIYFMWNVKKENKPEDLPFEKLIDACSELNVINDELSKKLHQLRSHRNTIHSSMHIKRRRVGKMYEFDDREKAKKITEELRLALGDWYKKPETEDFTNF